MRFQKTINTFEEGVIYYKKRTLQLLREGYILTKIFELEYGVGAIFKSDVDDEIFYSLYIYENKLKQGYYSKFMDEYNHPTILTSDDCDLDSYLDYKGYENVCVNFNNDYFYNLISEFYGDKIAARSGVELMNHIDEGIFIMRELGIGSLKAEAAYCLHPMVQSDEELASFYEKFNDIAHKGGYDFDPQVLLLAMEYRSVANEYLSNRNITDISEIRLSPIDEVNDMLIADKIQNRKDFELYHLGKHQRSYELVEYFNNWLERLGISEEKYQMVKSKLEIKPEIIRFGN